MALPSELILEVCKHLPKRALKACRLVSKSWSHSASEYLFSNIYISPRKEDIEVFNFITQHAQLRHCVRRLEYDGTSFSPIYSKKDYTSCLLEKKTAFSDLYRAGLNSTDPQFVRFIRSCSNHHKNLSIRMKGYSNLAFIVEGHREWIHRDGYQQKIVKNGEFLQTLTHGLRKLDHLKSVEVCNEWHTWGLSDTWRPIDGKTRDLSDPYFYGSPFGRAWGLLHPQPHSWVQEAVDTDGFATGHEEFEIITTALSQSQRHICSFHISSLPVSIFDSNITGNLGNISVNAFSSLENLTLNFDDYIGSTKMSIKYKSLPDLQALLRSMIGLRRLQLMLPHDGSHGNKFFTYRQVFPTDNIQWMRLRKLDIGGLAISAKELVHLLGAKMPNLRELAFSDVRLLEGRWEGVIEFLKTSMQLVFFRLEDAPQLVCLGLLDIMDDGEDEDDLYAIIYSQIIAYVVSGGRHPCLPLHEDNSASEKYLLDLGL